MVFKDLDDYSRSPLIPEYQCGQSADTKFKYELDEVGLEVA